MVTLGLSSLLKPVCGCPCCVAVFSGPALLNPQLTNPDPIVVFCDLLLVCIPSWALSGISARRGDHWIAVALSGIAETAPELADSETDCKS